MFYRLSPKGLGFFFEKRELSVFSRVQIHENGRRDRE